MKPFSTLLMAAIRFFLLASFSGIALASTAINGIWSNSAGGYLVVLEQSSGGSVVVLQVDPALATGKTYIGSRSGDTVTAKTMDQTATFSASFGGTAYSGTLSSGGAAQTIGGNLLFAYAGGPYDGIWQRTGDNYRYLTVISATIDQANAVVLVDVALNTTTYAATYDVATGLLSTAATPTFAGRSLLSGNTISLMFAGGNSATATYSSYAGTRPPQLVEQFGTTQIFAVGTTAP